MGSLPISSPMAPPPRGPSLADRVERFREICLALPDVEERLNHGMPTFGVAKRPAFCNLHESPTDGRPNLWFKAAPGVQAELVEQEPDRFFVPPYVGPRGWVGLRLDVDLDWDEVAGVVEECWRLTAPRRLITKHDGIAAKLQSADDTLDGR